MSYKKMLETISAERRRVRLSQRSLAAQAGISETRMSKVMSGKLELTASELLRLMAALGIKEV